MGTTSSKTSAPRARRGSSGLRRRFGPAAAGAGVLTKVLLAVKSLAFLAKFKVVGSMLISVVAYSWIFGWWYAAGFVALLAIHETGHMLAFRAQGVPVTTPTFIPFMGAFVRMKEQPKTVTQEALGALAGPALGTLAALGAYGLARQAGSPLLQALAYSGFLLNVFNLIPALPLDGGRVAGALHPALWVVGLVVAGGYEFIHPNVLLVFVLVLGVAELARRWKTRRWVDAAYYQVRRRTRLSIAAGYLTVATVCLLGMAVAYIPR